jgi:hypothetical protein
MPRIATTIALIVGKDCIRKAIVFIAPVAIISKE